MSTVIIKVIIVIMWNASFLRKLGPVESIQYPVPGKDSPTALVTYQLHKDARVAVNQLTGKTFKG